MNDRELFPTPAGLANLMVEVARESYTPVSNKPARVLEPSAGKGDICEAIIRQTNWSITAVEPFDDQSASVSEWLRCKFEEFKSEEPFDIVLMNPPFSLAQEHVALALTHLRTNGVLVALVPLNFIGTQKRERFFRRCPPAEVCVISPRPSFSADKKTARSEYAIAVWRKGANMRSLLSWRRWFEPVATESETASENASESEFQ